MIGFSLGHLLSALGTLRVLRDRPSLMLPVRRPQTARFCHDDFDGMVGDDACIDVEDADARWRHFATRCTTSAFSRGVCSTAAASHTYNV